ncbi:MAG: aspartate carbamoyltransferase [Spirochaetales bacterium]|nr:aspartate carbamoyltransferase [Spirochaetales bacterium]
MKSATAKFKSRTIAVVRDLSIDEQVYLYNKTRELKEAINGKKSLQPFMIDDPQVGVYLAFLEDSTRTRESFKNAAHFHKTRMNILDVDHSSFKKKESYSDTFKMLCGYNEYSVFIVRTKLEGVCRWLESSLTEYANRNGFSPPAFINAGDGKHEHPTQEFLDEYTFFEHKKWDRNEIHIALIGDLFHGRTVHSKADGLKIFKNVTCDLIAPEELAMPENYIAKMKDNGFEIRIFESIKEYLANKKIAPIWYFTRLQLERMGEDIREKGDRLRRMVTFKRSYLDNLPEGVRFYHPLPRNKLDPVIPTFLDSTPLNGWELQALNGYFTRIIEIGMVGGKIGYDFEGSPPDIPEFIDDFIEEVPPVTREKEDYKIGIKPITKGVVIDHIGKGDEIETIWDHILKIRKTLSLNLLSSHGVFNSHKTNQHKGIISIPDITEFDQKNLKKLAAIAPECTLNFIKDQEVIRKFRLHMPPRVYNFDELGCRNPDCISHPDNAEDAQTEFYRSHANKFICKYCERPHTFKEIWKQ